MNINHNAFNINLYDNERLYVITNDNTNMLCMQVNVILGTYYTFKYYTLYEYIVYTRRYHQIYHYHYIINAQNNSRI